MKRYKKLKSHETLELSHENFQRICQTVEPQPLKKNSKKLSVENKTDKLLRL